MLAPGEPSLCSPCPCVGDTRSGSVTPALPGMPTIPSSSCEATAAAGASGEAGEAKRRAEEAASGVLEAPNGPATHAA
uniref:Uncharacterized protein n=1 Tax=Peronospora matthiolae TaxID=2874970 RepID=A0AAV1T4C6_9STRA